MAISTNLLARIARQSGARKRLKGLAEDLAHANAYYFVVEEDDAEERMAGIWIAFNVLDRAGEWHKEAMLFCRKEVDYGD